MASVCESPVLSDGRVMVVRFHQRAGSHRGATDAFGDLFSISNMLFYLHTGIKRNQIGSTSRRGTMPLGEGFDVLFYTALLRQGDRVWL